MPTRPKSPKKPPRKKSKLTASQLRARAQKGWAARRRMAKARAG